MAHHIVTGDSTADLETYLITGAFGHIGSYIVEELIKTKNDIQIVCVDNFYNANIDNLKIPEAHNSVGHAYHLYPLQIDFDKLSLTKSEYFEKMKQVGINLQVHYIPVHLQPYYKRNYGFTSGYCLISESFYEWAVSIPLYPSLTDTEVDRVVTNILGFVESK